MSSPTITHQRQLESPRLTALRMVQVARTPRVVGRLLCYAFLLLPPALLFIPWQQSVSATGRVIARDPMKRPQIIQAPIYGRIDESWVSENLDVKAGDKLLRIVDNDPMLNERLDEELAAKRSKLIAAQQKVKISESNIKILEEALEQTNYSYESLVKAANNKFKAKEAERDAAIAGEKQSRLNLERQKQLRTEGIVSQLDLEREERKYQEDFNKLRKAEEEIKESQNELISKEADLEKALRESQAKINTAKGYVQEAEGDVALAEAELATQRIKIGRVGAQEILAPADGRIVRVLANQGAEVLKEGTPLLEFVPFTDDFAVELLLDGNDVPLVQSEHLNAEGKTVPADKVRLQFEGWPAVQFVGWPSVAVGTFGGQVQLVDAMPYSNGKFRIVVVPDPSDPHHWPEHRFLRQGNQANGWVLLRTVPLGMELWRRLNGFPPIVSFDSPKKDSKGESSLDPLKKQEKEAEYKIKLK